LPQQDVEAVARAAFAAELERERRMQQAVEVQFRKAAGERIESDSLTRRVEFERSEAVRLAEFQEQAAASAKARAHAWQEESEVWSREVIAKARADIAAYSRSQGASEIEARELEQAQASEAAAAVANAHKLVCDRYRGDGREAIREQQRKRDDAWANSRRAVQARYSAQVRSAGRVRNEMQFEADVCARVKSEASRREQTWLAAERTLQRDAEVRFVAGSEARRNDWQRNETILVAEAKSKLEADVLQLKQSYVKRSPPGMSPGDPTTQDDDIRRSSVESNRTAGGTAWPQVTVGAVVAALLAFVKFKAA